MSADQDPSGTAYKALGLLGRSPDFPLPTLEWPGEQKPKSWWGCDAKGQLTKVYRDYAAYCAD